MDWFLMFLGLWFLLGYFGTMPLRREWRLEFGPENVYPPWWWVAMGPIAFIAMLLHAIEVYNARG